MTFENVKGKVWQPLGLAVLALLIAGAGCGGESTPAPPPLCAARPSGLSSWWKGQGNAQDSVGGRNGTINGNVTFAAAKVMQGFVFDGTAYVTMGAATGTPLNVGASDFTLEFWLKTNSDLSSGLGQFIAGHANLGSTAPGFRVVYQPGVNHQLRFRIADSSPANTIVDTPPVNDGMWHHYAFVRSGNMLLAYVDGALSASVMTTVTDATTGTNTEFQVGGRNPGASGPPDSLLEGSLDELSFYTRALSAAEINSIFTAGEHGKC